MHKYLLFILTTILAACTSGSHKKQQVKIAEVNKTSTLAEQKQDVDKKTEPKKEVDNSFEGTYYCGRSGDTYKFNKDGTGSLLVKGGISPSTFKWSRSGSNVVITFTGQSSAFGKQKLTYNEKKKTITEESKSFGTLTFTKSQH